MKEFSKEEMMSFARFCREFIGMIESGKIHPANKFEKSYDQMFKSWQKENRKNNLDDLIQ